MKTKISKRDNQAAEYVGGMARELARMCRDENLLTLAYLFEMAFVESLEIQGLAYRAKTRT